MNIYKLTPIDLSSHHWKASIFRGEIIIRAENEDRARTIATNALWIATPAISGALKLYNPWGRLGAFPSAVSCWVQILMRMGKKPFYPLPNMMLTGGGRKIADVYLSYGQCKEED